jgi:hypothetical protein
MPRGLFSMLALAPVVFKEVCVLLHLDQGSAAACQLARGRWFWLCSSGRVHLCRYSGSSGLMSLNHGGTADNCSHGLFSRSSCGY